MALVFDYDGVIVDARKDNINAINSLAHKYGYEHMTFEAYQAMCTHNFYEYWQMLLGIQAKEFFKDLHAMPRNKVPLLPGMREILAAHRPAIVSSNFTQLIKNTLADYSIELDIYGGEMDPSKVRKLQRIRREPNVFVTDTAGDITEGKQAGYFIIAVTWGFYTLRDIQKAQPHAIVHTPHELHEHLVKLRCKVDPELEVCYSQ